MNIPRIVLSVCETGTVACADVDGGTLGMRTMDVSDVMTELRTFIRQEFKIQDRDRDFNDDVHLFDYGYVDSFGAVRILSFIETQFGVTISDTDLTIHPMNTIREISTLVTERIKR